MPIPFSLNEFRPKPTIGLVDLIRNHDHWEQVSARTVSHPWDAFYRTKGANNATPLHLACMYRAPFRVVQLILRAHPAAVHVMDTQGWTPLYLALLYGADDETCLLLIQQGVAPTTCKFMRSTPLHIACRHGASPRILEALVQSDPTMLMCSTESGMTALGLLWNQYCRKHPEYHQALLNSTRESLSKDPSIVDLLEKLTVLLPATDKNELTPLPIHAMITDPHNIGLAHFVPLLVRLYPEQLERRDDHGNLPLHLACCRPPSLQQYGVVVDLLPVVLQGFPLAASTRNQNGQYPLHLAVMQGRRRWNTGVIILVKAFPDALLFVDPLSGLFPVQLAAAAAAAPVSEDNTSHGEHLDTILELLLAWPPVLIM